MKNHPTQEQWMEYLYGEMESAARKSLETHVKNCVPCLGKQKEFTGAINTLDMWRLDLPKKHSIAVPRNRFQPVLKWAAAAALLVTTGFAAARFSQPSFDVEAFKAQISAEIKSEIQAPLEVKIGETLEAAAAQAAAGAREKLDMAVAARSHEIALRTRSDALLAVREEMEELRLNLEALREDDRKIMNAALKNVENQWLAQLRTMREDLERVALFSDESYRAAQRQFVQLANYSQPLNEPPTDATDHEN